MVSLSRNPRRNRLRFIPQKDGLLVLSPAKLNLALYLIGRRSDGYHTIKTLMTPITLFDRILFQPSKRWRLIVSGLSVPSDSRNTILKAVKSFERYYGVKVNPLEVRLEKRIPPGSGLGGGSSNAAATILALHYFTSSPQIEEQDILCALEVGADVPFFLKCSPYWMEGIGERFARRVEMERCRYMVVVPNFVCDTAKVYSGIHLTCASVSGKIYNGLEDDTVRGVPLRNELEDAAQRVYPRMRKLLELLRPQGFRMTGSGSAFFGPPRLDWLITPPRPLNGADLFLVETYSGIEWF